jgi:hypothetical protein
MNKYIKKKENMPFSLQNLTLFNVGGTHIIRQISSVGIFPNHVPT